MSIHNHKDYNLVKGRFWAPKDDSHISKWQCELDRLDHDVWTAEMIYPYIKNSRTILDGGSYNGDHTISYSRIVSSHPDGHVLAVEPGAIAYKALEHNCLLFEHQNVTPIHAALWSEDGTNLSHEPQQNLGASHIRSFDIDPKNSFQGFTIDTLSRMFDLTFDFIKLDLEGSEVHALRGATKVLKEQRPIMLIEVNTAKLSVFNLVPEVLFQLLREFKYEFRPIQPNCEYSEPQYDIICLPEPI